MKVHLDRNSFVPLYAQILQGLRQQIADGAIAPGAPVPSERELSEQYGVSRMTARQALRALNQDGLVYRERGIGTFVAKRKVDVHTRNLVGFTEEMRQRGLNPSTKVISIKREAALAQTAEILGIAEGAEVFTLERLRSADDSPMAFELNSIPVELCPDLDKHDLERHSLYEIFEQEYGISMHRADEVLEAAAAPRREAKHLQIKIGAPVLVVHRVVYSDADTAVESVRTTYRADRYRATFHLMKTKS